MSKIPTNFERRAALAYARQIMSRSRRRAKIKNIAIAEALHVTEGHVRNIVDGQFSLHYDQLLLLASEPATQEFVRQLVAPIQEMIDATQLRACDLLAMSKSDATIDVARAVLFETAKRLWPKQLAELDPEQQEPQSTEALSSEASREVEAAREDSSSQLRVSSENVPNDRGDQKVSI